MNDIQTSTIRVPKSTLESIKIYCRKAGKPIGEWVETAWKFIDKNDFDIYDNEAAAALPVPAEKERNQVDALCQMMAQFISAQHEAKELPSSNEVSLYVIQERDREIKELRSILEEVRAREVEKDRLLTLAKSELRKCKGVFGTADERALLELGIQ